jgi:hypothetical protein
VQAQFLSRDPRPFLGHAALFLFLKLERSDQGQSHWTRVPTRTVKATPKMLTAAQVLSSIGVAMTTDAAGGIWDTGLTTPAFNDACKAAWFNVVYTPVVVLPTNVAAGAVISSEQAVVTMPTSTINQSACENTSPGVTITVS